MKKKIVILGSTGSIGRTTVNLIKKDKKKFNVILLTTYKNINLILNQSKELNVKNIIVSSKPHYLKIKKKNKNKKLIIHNNLEKINKIVRNKIDYSMCSITGLAGLKPTLDCIKFSKSIAIANKESIICAWELIKKKLDKYKTKFIPVDSEHFSIWSVINHKNIKNVEKIFITASGGPFLNKPLNKIRNASPASALKHPNWKMGKKISIDSATMMNKVFEVIEAQRIFDLDLGKFTILIHPDSYIHSIVKFNNGLIKICAHDTDMSIPIFNSIYLNERKNYKSKDLNLNLLNNLNFKKPDNKRFPVLKILKKIPNYNSLLETILVSANDELVNLFLKGKIKYPLIHTILNRIVNKKRFKRYRKIKVKNIEQIYRLSKEVRLIINKLCNKNR